MISLLKVITYNYLLFLTLLLIIQPITAFGIDREKVTLNKCLELSAIRNPDLQKATIESKLNLPGAKAAWGRFLPLISVGYSIDQSQFYNPTYLNPDGSVATFPRLDTLTTTYIDSLGYVRVSPIPILKWTPIPEGKRRSSALSLRIDEIIFDGARNYYNLKNVKLANQVRNAQSRNTEMRVRYEVTLAYCNAVAAERRLILAEQAVSQRRLLLELAQIRFETGSVTRRDVLQAEVELGRARADSINAVLNAKRALEELNLTIGLPVDTIYILADLEPTFEPLWEFNTLKSLALNNREDFKILNLQGEIQRNELKSNRSEYLPTITASIIHTRNEQSGAGVNWTLDPRNRYTQVGLTASWVLFDRFTRSLQVEQSKVNLNKNEIENLRLQETIIRDIKTALERLKSFYQQSIVSEQNAILAEQTLEFERERYRVGSATQIEVNSALLSYFQSQIERISITAEFHKTLGELEYAVGVPLRDVK